MAVENLIYPPNKPLERVLSQSEEPVLYDYLSIIDVNDKGEFILGCSNVSGGYWESSLFFYNNDTAALKNEYSSYFNGTASISDAILIPNTTKILLAEDTLSLKLVDTTNSSSLLKCDDFLFTNALVRQLASWHTDKKIVGCAGTQVSVWNANNGLELLAEFKNVHTDVIKSVSVNKTDNNLFATASMDKQSCVWDDRMKQPAAVLYQNDFCGLTSIAWNPRYSQQIVVGSKAGELYNIDVRQPKEFLTYHHCFDSPIHRLKFNDLGNLAICGDRTEVMIFNCEENFNLLHKANKHSSYVRGIAWLENVLYSCGFDKRIIKHVF